MKIAFFELEDWQKRYLRNRLKGNELVFYNQNLTEDFTGDLSDVDTVCSFIYSKINRATIEKAKQIKLVCTLSTGFDHIDLEYCKERGIAVCNVPRYGENTVAEHTFALILALSRKVIPSVDLCRRGNFDNASVRGFDLKDKTIGIVGTGNIGLHVARLAEGFQMKVLTYDVHKNEEIVRNYHAGYVDLDKLLANSDIISLHLPAIPETFHILDESSFAKMKKGVYIINTARGTLIDTEALVRALNSGIVAGAGIDVFEEEGDLKEETALLSDRFPKNRLMLNIANNMLLRDQRVIVTPHNAFNSTEALERILSVTVENITSFEGGNTVNSVFK